MNLPKHLSSVLLAATLGIGMAALTTPSYGQAQKPADTESTAPRLFSDALIMARLMASLPGAAQ